MGYTTILFSVICSVLLVQSQTAYLSFARGGRSGSLTCCPVGLKTEYVTEFNANQEQAGPRRSHNCPPEVGCCAGLHEVVKVRNTDQTFYTLCVPSKTNEHSSVPNYNWVY